MELGLHGQRGPTQLLAQLLVAAVLKLNPNLDLAQILHLHMEVPIVLALTLLHNQ